MNLFYDMPLFRPPSEGDNLIIQATLGCSFNQCSFCAMYRSKHYIERLLDAVIADIRQAAADWPDAHRVFLADGDALALPTEHLLAILRELAAALPRLTRVSCYATPGNLQRKSAAELALLREHKLNLLYFGIESGSDLILKMPDDLAILQEQERLISGLNPPHPIIFRSNHASNALALAGNLPKDKEKLLLQLREAMAGIRPLRPFFMRGL